MTPDLSMLLHDPEKIRRQQVIDALPDGMLEYQCRLAIRDLIALHGFEEARSLIAGYLNDEAKSEHPRRVA